MTRRLTLREKVWIDKTLNKVTTAVAASSPVSPLEGEPGPAGNIADIAAVANCWISSVVAGVPLLTQPGVSNISGFGTGVATALGINVGSAGAVIVFNGALGTPTSGVATNLTGTAAGLSIGGNAATATSATTAGSATTATTATNQSGGTVNATTGVFSSTLTPSQTAGIVGTTTNNSVQAGSVGEYVESVVGATSVPTSTQWGDLTSISLTAGDWDVTGVILYGANGATVTDNEIGISTTSGNFSTGLTVGSNRLSVYIPLAGANSGGSIPEYRMSLAATTTVYLKMNSTYTVATPNAYGRLSARRRR